MKGTAARKGVDRIRAHLGERGVISIQQNRLDGYDVYLPHAEVETLVNRSVKAEDAVNVLKAHLDRHVPNHGGTVAKATKADWGVGNHLKIMLRE